MSSITEEIIRFIQKTFTDSYKTQAIIAVSGGIDSAVVLTLTTRALGATNTHALLLPYAKQSTDDARLISSWNQLAPDHIFTENIQGPVDVLTTQLRLRSTDQVRRGNLMARTRMIMLYDYAKRLDALVVGTENHSEDLLGYFTRFGDAASDLEPIQHLTKTKVRALSLELGIPDQFRTKPPSAGLWDGQTDEQELGFSYTEADTYIDALTAQKPIPLSPTMIAKIKARIASQEFKHHVPYTLMNQPETE